MGYSRWKSREYAAFANTAGTKTRGALFSRTDKHAPTSSGQEVNVENIDYRESRDSEANPLATPVLVGLDVTGSMGIIPEALVKGGLGTFVDSVLQRKPVTDPHLLFMAIGDAIAGDQAPLQATQFESDNRICTQLTDLWLEGRGGGNNYESYDLAWAFAAYRTRTDAWDKRKAKGFLFTVGDEQFPLYSCHPYMQKVFRGDCPQTPTPEGLLVAVKERYRVFHVIIAEGGYASLRLSETEAVWRERLQKRALTLYDYHYLPQLMVSAIALDEGVEVEEVMSWWDQGVVKVLRQALMV